MKIYIDKTKFKAKNFERIIEQIKDIEFVTEVEDSFDADVIIVEPTFVIEENIKKYKNLKWIQSIRAGFDTVDFSILNKRNITFTNAKDVYSISIAEDVIGKILALNRNTFSFLKNMELKEWKPNFNAYELYKTTVGIVGMGSIAREIAKRIKAFDAKVIGYRRNYREEEYFDEVYVGEAGLNKLLQESDYVILTVSLNEGTKGLINLDKLNLMKDSALLINIARGDVVVQADLIKALKMKKIRGAGLDVFTPEPLPKDSELWSLDNVFITPHCSAASFEINNRLTDLVIENLKRYQNKQELLNIV